jgi:exopolysaccharide biosynthesis polyprenyl glycosylphosphotransferase
MRLFDNNASVPSDPGDTPNKSEPAIRERSVAQSRLRQPLSSAAGLSTSKPGARNLSRALTAGVALAAADVALLALAMFIGYQMKLALVPDDMMAGTPAPFWIPVLFVAMSAALLRLTDSKQVSAHGLSARDWAQTAGIISFTGVVAWGISELMSHGSMSSGTATAIWAASIVLIPFGRAAVRQVLHGRGIGCRRIVVVGDMDKAMDVIKQLSKSGSHYRVAGLVSPGNEAIAPVTMPLSSETPATQMRGIESLLSLVESEQATDVLIAVSNTQYASVHETVRKTLPEDVTLHVALDPLLNETASGEQEMVEGMPAVRFRSRSMPWQYEALKRAFDFSAALFLLFMASPLLIAVAVIVKLDSSGPVFFKGQRVGRRGERFGMYKFRSMRVGAEAMLADLEKLNEASGAMFKMKNDPRITRVGKILRKLSIDELPQLFNVLNGTMSLVGPRPPLPKEVQVYEERHFERLDGVPGITGLWQIKRGPELDFEEMVQFDIEYLRNWSLMRDFMILLKTIPVVLTGRGAY